MDQYLRRRSFSIVVLSTAVIFILFSPAKNVLSEEEEEDPLIRQVVSDLYSDDPVLDAEGHFATFIGTFGKKYKSEEEHASRFEIFKENMRKARIHQKLDPSAIHGVTQFSDLTPEEFEKGYLGVHRGKEGKIFRSRSGEKEAPILPTNNLPDDFDWREHGAVTEVRNQGPCGSCWSFSATGALEGANYLATGNLVSLSEQQLLDCDHQCDPSDPRLCDAGCDGGLMSNAFEYSFKVGGLQSEKDYPYTGEDGHKCKFDHSKIAASVSSFSAVSSDDNQIAANLVENGPIAVGINAVFMQTYIGGVSCPYLCSKNLDHGVLLVGYGNAGFAPIRMKLMPYWIIKNSWGKHWGEKGYYKICKGRNVCGVDSMASMVSAQGKPTTTSQ